MTATRRPSPRSAPQPFWYCGHAWTISAAWSRHLNENIGVKDVFLTADVLKQAFGPLLATPSSPSGIA